MQEFPNYEKKSEQHARRYKSLFSPILTKQSDIEALLIEFSLVCGNELEETYNKGLKIEINKLYLSYIELIENQIDFEDRRITEEDFSSREKELAGILWPLRKEKDETGLKIAKQIKDMISILTPNLIR